MIAIFIFHSVLINSTTNNSFFPKVARSSDGRYMVIWTEMGKYNSSYFQGRIYGKVMNESFNSSVSGRFVIGKTEDNNKWDHCLWADVIGSGNGFIVSWVDYGRKIGEKIGWVRCMRYLSNGNKDDNFNPDISGIGHPVDVMNSTDPPIWCEDGMGGAVFVSGWKYHVGEGVFEIEIKNVEFKHILRLDKIRGRSRINTVFNKEVKMIEEYEIGDKMRIQSDKIYRGGVL